MMILWQIAFRVPLLQKDTLDYFNLLKTKE